MSNTKYIFISGGVLSGVGKGVTAAALGSLLQLSGYKVSAIKCENYLNVDSGTINPIEHGDPFLCNDGLEADMDLGSYERFLDVQMGFKNFTTMGQVYKCVIDREREMGYKGEDVEAIPHVVDEITTRIEAAGEDCDICLVELGGTVGEYQNMLYYEAARLLKIKLGVDRVINVHVSYLPVPKHLGEPKTKPTQMSVTSLMSMGIQPDFLVLRSEVDLDERRRYILGLKTSVPGEQVIVAQDVESIYELPLSFAAQEFDLKVLKALNLSAKSDRPLDHWQKVVTKIKSKKSKKVEVAIVGKYFSKNKGDFVLLDAYHALIEALKHSAWDQNTELVLRYVSSIDIEHEGAESLLSGVDGIVVPIGWGTRGVEGKIDTIKYAREEKIPYLGLCYGMQLAAIEFARNVVGLEGANTTEIDPDTKYPIVHDIPLDEGYQVIKGEGVSMRLGAYDAVFKPGTVSEEIYRSADLGRKSRENDGKWTASERHRHRYEFNNSFREQLEEQGLVISATSPDDFFVEMIELPKDTHPFFVATQAHPEYKSTPHQPHPLFNEFIKQSARS